jgi:molybdopterin-containing oxidoreductase family membrane subunit
METAMPDKKYVMGLFNNEDQVVSTLAALKETAYQFQRVHSPIPSHKILAALDLKKSKVGYFTLFGGIFGLISGFSLAIYCSTEWNLIVSGKPIVSLIPFFIVGFEFTILFAVFGNVIGLLTQARLPSFRGMVYYDPRCSGEHFGVLAACEPTQQDGLRDFFQQNGGETKVFE